MKRSNKYWHACWRCIVNLLASMLPGIALLAFLFGVTGVLDWSRMAAIEHKTSRTFSTFSAMLRTKELANASIACRLQPGVRFAAN